ncbi:uncharacterized membrane protein, possible Na+ channel or pump [Bellilinea caldifistulae]|uniref:Membrane protein n=1 Tax=Bellilinea caldifistulae TaxID=360411 RepID=A0A0P6XUQ3_9CHLR|nr:DUF554 domain-containing protein [Bellilinea caldifistulae]KPL77176.1 membrane protein [Bellilinea caldifistulae]GAP10141.1 uncharacterized membrane protein, possible Na+ channel or pump [Bellilinea caldifistulae]
MTGTLINVVTILIGGLLGLVLGSRLPERLRQTVMAGLGLFTFAFGLKMFLDTQNALAVLISLLLGAVIGEWLRIEDGLRSVGRWLETRFTRSSDPAQDNRFVRGFLTASLVFCVGPMAILGSIQDGLTGNFQTLAVKAILDGFGALAFASTLGVGVLFSAVVLLGYQGGISLMAAQLQALITPAMMQELNATGGVILLAIAIGSLLEIKPIRAGNFLPALVIAPLMVVLMQALGVY